MKSRHRRIICRLLIHLTLFVLAFSYMVIGGYVLCSIENRKLQKSINADSITIDQSEVEANNRTPNLQGTVNLNRSSTDICIERFAAFIETSNKSDEIKVWTLLDGFLYAYSALTTIGYGNLATVTDSGRVFYVFFGIIGIVIFALVINDLGYYIQEFLNFAYSRFFRKQDDRESAVPLKSIVLLPVTLVIFVLYLALGGILLPMWERDWDFVKAFYVSFDAISTVGIGDIYPRNNSMFVPTLIYFTFGMAIGCAGMSFLGDFGRALHFLGAKPENCGEQIAWFAGRHMKIGDLVEIVGSEFGATRSEIKCVKASLDRLIRERLRQKSKSSKNKTDEHSFYFQRHCRLTD